ncbi:hypothetical protein HF086_009822 [Spodoptera exigua]|uniref:Pupal cuticle protein C1B n=1 Tax=Spodoptera exigua TaxID=7107 RepID=A0A922MWS9_SPOEX|nr:hypothetical protein HF086_009822 [Spodoptera exigua]
MLSQIILQVRYHTCAPSFIHGEILATIKGQRARLIKHIALSVEGLNTKYASKTALSNAGLISPVYNAPYAYGGWNPYSSYPAQPAIASQHSNILRSPFNLGQVSTYTKSIDTPFSSVRKADVRVSNPGVAIAPAYTRFASPLVSHVGVAAPVAKVATTAGLLGVAYSAAPTVSHMTYTNGLGLAYGW